VSKTAKVIKSDTTHHHINVLLSNTTTGQYNHAGTVVICNYTASNSF